MNQLLAMRAFVRVVETGSFSRAAEQSALPRSTVSKLITDLEIHLGIKLMHRTTRTVAVTAEGLEYYEQAMRLLADVDAVDHAVRGKTLKPSGHLRIDAPASFANCLLIPALPDFHRQYPDVTIALGISDRTINIVGEGVDCVIRAGELQDMMMIGRKITDLDYATCASPSYLKRMGMPSSPADLKANHIHAGYFFPATGKPEPLILENGSERYEIDNCEFSTNEGSGLINLMLAGLGIGQHLRRFLQPYIDSGRLVEILPDWSRPSIPFHAVYPPNRHQSARLKVFVDWVINELK
ncbi:LysR family transcriptional regulator [Dickeya dianthicola]|uniref:LysR family transcriptional regulator n=1 Tax=Dickeya dianthicola TaxID=204039 RepID=UPI001865FC1F|nr:LysR family transcriptional regulator [Dickeya dianthicola]QOL13460.1 LysR family transcriptional regulator [Dickeya dianthicola]